MIRSSASEPQRLSCVRLPDDSIQRGGTWKLAVIVRLSKWKNSAGHSPVGSRLTTPISLPAQIPIAIRRTHREPEFLVPNISPDVGLLERTTVFPGRSTVQKVHLAVDLQPARALVEIPIRKPIPRRQTAAPRRWSAPGLLRFERRQISRGRRIHPGQRRRIRKRPTLRQSERRKPRPCASRHNGYLGKRRLRRNCSQSIRGPRLLSGQGRNQATSILPPPRAHP